MKSPAQAEYELSKPQLLYKTIPLATYLKSLSPAQLTKAMNISPALALKTHALIASWSADDGKQRPAIDSFLGDIFSGLQVPTWSKNDRAHANETLRILSGLYGILRPLDGICPYRLEMGYKLLDDQFADLYTYWGNTIATSLPVNEPVINLAAVEYSKTVTSYIDKSHITTPSFLTINPTTNKPTFIVVHAKIARGAYARWLITNKITSPTHFHEFSDIGYEYNKELSQPQMPVFVCKEFGGKGLSVRLM